MNLKQIIKTTAAVILLTAVILGVGTGPLAKAAGDSSFEVSLQTGYNGFLEIGINSPFSVTVKNNSNDFEGSVWLIIQTGREDVSAYEKKISLAAGSSKTVNFIATVPVSTNECAVKITDLKGKTVFSKGYPLNFDTMHQYARVGILSDNYNALSQISGNRLEQIQDISVLTEKFTEKTFPEDARALEFMDALILSDFASDRLSDAQRTAILEWVSDGGLLILGTGTGASKVLKGFPELNNVKVGSLRTVSTRFGASGQYREPTNSADYGYYNTFYEEQARRIFDEIDTDFFVSEEFAALPDEDALLDRIYEQNRSLFIKYCWLDYNGESYALMKSRLSETEMAYQETYFKDYCVNNICEQILKLSSLNKAIVLDDDAPYYKAQITEPQSGAVLIKGDLEGSNDTFNFATCINYGSGTICTVAADVSMDPFVSSPYCFSTFSYLITYFKGAVLYEDYYSGGYSYNQNTSEYRSVATRLAFGNLLPVPAYFLIFTAYTTLGFIAFFFLRKRKKSIYLWPVQIGLALIATLLVTICGMASRINHPVVNSIKISEATDNVVNELTLSGVILPKNRQYEIDFDKNYKPQLLRDFGYYSFMNSVKAVDLEPNISWLDKADCNSLSLRGNAALSAEAFAFTRSKTPENYEIDFSPVYKDCKLSGYVRNNTERTLEDCVVLIDYLIYHVGTLTPGSKADLSKIEPVSVFSTDPHSGFVVSNYDDLCKEIAGLSDSDNFDSYLMGFKNNEYKKDMLKYKAVGFTYFNESYSIGRVLKNSAYAEATYSYSGPIPSSKYYYYYSNHTFEELREICGLDEDGHPYALISQPCFVGFDFETAGSILADNKQASENILEMIMVQSDIEPNN